jgi:hypothetical protein
MPWSVELCVCMMMLGFMTLLVLVLWSECWCIVVLYPQWHQLPSWVSLLYLPHPCHLSLFQLTRGVTGRKLKADARWRNKTSLYLPSHLVLAFIPPSSLWWRPQQPTKKKIKGFTLINKRGWLPTYFDRNVFGYLPPPCFFFLRISGRDSV